MIMFTKLYGVYKVRSKAREQSGSYVLRLLSLVSTNALVSKQRRNYLLIMSLHLIVCTYIAKAQAYHLLQTQISGINFLSKSIESKAFLGNVLLDQEQ